MLSRFYNLSLDPIKPRLFFCFSFPSELPGNCIEVLPISGFAQSICHQPSYKNVYFPIASGLSTYYSGYYSLVVRAYNNT